SVELAAADRELASRTALVSDEDAIVLDRVVMRRLEEKVRRPRPLRSLQLRLPGERLGVGLPLVPPLLRRHVDVLDLLLGIEAREGDMHILDLARLEPVARRDVVVPVLSDPSRGR